MLIWIFHLLDSDPATPGRQTKLDVPGKGQFTVDNSGNVTFTPALNFNGIVNASYRVCDKGDADTGKNILCATTTITVNVTAVNDAPIARDDTAIVGSRDSVAIHVLDNDTDPDGDLLTIATVTAPSTRKSYSEVLMAP